MADPLYRGLDANDYAVSCDPRALAFSDLVVVSDVYLESGPSYFTPPNRYWRWFACGPALRRTADQGLSHGRVREHSIAIALCLVKRHGQVDCFRIRHP